MQTRALLGSLLVSIVGAAGCGTREPPPSTAVSAAGSPATEPPPAPRAAANPDLAAGRAAAQAWLGLVDAEKYEESWRSAAKLFQSALAEAAWASSLAHARRPLGQVLSRQPKSGEMKTTLPGVPDGKYVLLRFDTAFANKAAAVETVTTLQEADGSWKVAGYFIR